MMIKLNTFLLKNSQKIQKA